MNDKLLILEDTNGDGRADKCITFADHLHNPTGFEFYNGGVLVAMAPDLLFLKDTDGDDKADIRERVLSGLDSADTHHTSNSFTLDPGGALYFQEGTFHHTQVETPYGPPVRLANAGVFRYEPRAQKFDVYVTYGFANPHGHVFDRWGQDIVVDGTGANPYHAALFSGHVEFPHKHPTPPMVYKQRTRPCPGIEYLSSRHFPDEMQGNLLVGNVIGFQGILQYKIADKGASFTGDRGRADPLVERSELPARRPRDRTRRRDLLHRLAQPDHRPHAAQPPRSQSRPRRMAASIASPTRAARCSSRRKIAGEPIDKLLDLLKEPEDRVRYRAKIELSGRNTRRGAVGASIAGSPASTQGSRSTSTTCSKPCGSISITIGSTCRLLDRLLAAPDFRARAAAARVLCYWRDRVPRLARPAEEAGGRSASAGPARGGPRGQLLHRARGGRDRRDRRPSSRRTSTCTSSATRR